MVAAVKTACGREPLTVGKPNTPAFEYICRRWGVDSIDPRRTLMIGDRVNTDVKFGRDHGLRTLLVLSGCHGVRKFFEKIIFRKFSFKLVRIMIFIKNNFSIIPKNSHLLLVGRN